MDESKMMVPVEQREVTFYSGIIVAVRLASGEVFVPIRPICDQLGVTIQGQLQRIRRDPVLSEVATPVNITFTGHQHGQPQAVDMTCLPLHYLNGWLFGIQTGRVKEAVRNKLIAYQRECYQVLFEAFQDGRLTTQEDNISDLLNESDSPAAQAYRMARAIMQLSRQQFILENRLVAHDDQLAAHTERIEALETAVSELGAPGRYITNAQASQLSQAVKAVAMAMSKQTRRNEYGGVYGELYRRYDITGYKMLPARKFEDAMKWLSEWLSQLNTTDGF